MQQTQREIKASQLPAGFDDRGDLGFFEFQLEDGEWGAPAWITHWGDTILVRYAVDDNGPYDTSFDLDETVTIRGRLP